MEKQSGTEHQKSFFEGLIEAQDRLYYYALQLTEDSDIAKDLVQETSYKALKNYTRHKDIEHRSAWLYTILKNTHINNLRSGHNKNIQTNSSDKELLVSTARINDRDHPDSVFERKELQFYIRQLPADYAKPLKLYINGYAYKEISKMTKVPLGTVKSRIHLAKMKLRSRYKENPIH